MLGIGAQHTKDPNGVAWKQNQDFENLLKRLNANSEDSTEDKTDVAPIDGFQPARVDDPAAAIGSEMEGRGEERGVEKEGKRKEKKRRRDDSETAKPEEKTSKKRKKAESITVATDIEPAEAGPSSSNSPTPETVEFVAIDCSSESGP